MKRLLMVAFQFPPFGGSSAVQRVLRFVQQLPSYGWEPIVLSASPRAYAEQSSDLLHEVPASTVVERAFALDAAQHLAMFGRYPGFLARPDRWITWRLGAVPSGFRLIRRYRPQIIWSTYPIATAHVVASDLHRLSGLPWVADFRDPMTEDEYPADAKTWRTFKQIEERTLRSAARFVFTTPGTAQLYQNRYADVSPERIRIIENGYAEESFAGVANLKPTPQPLLAGKITLVHSGVIYPSERDPTQLFAALRRLADEGHIGPDNLLLRLRAPGHEGLLEGLLNQYGVTDLVEIAGPLPYRKALEEMVRSDGLIVLQAASCNRQIPAKLYEYLRAGRPILGLTDPAGDTARVLREAGMNSIARLDSSEEIAETLLSFIDQVRQDSVALPLPDYVAKASRLSRTRQLANLLDELT